MKKSMTWLAVLVLFCVLCGCATREETDYLSWLPDLYVPGERETIQGEDYHRRQETVTDTKTALASCSAKTLVEHLLNNESILLAEKLWQSQIASGAYKVTQDELARNNLTFYVSSSDGDDNNLGLSPKEPKKTLQQFSGKSHITVLLKCGDVFEMEEGFLAGNGCIYATYGSGNRPVVSFYKKLSVPLERMTEYNNVWMADLLGTEGIYNGREDKDNCNIGQLLLNGEVNWKRVVVSTSVYEAFNFPADIEARADGSWTVDWLQSKLYLYSEEDPNEQEIYVAPDVHGIAFDSVKDTTLKGWTITGAGAHGCNITDADNVVVQSCFFYHIGGVVHRSVGIRYGNAVQIWNSGRNITVANNYADWVFDSCYTNQGASETAYCENVVFEKNIGAHAFTGIETWADSYSTIPSRNLIYRDNILYHMCDITDPEQDLFADKKGNLLLEEEEKKDYVTYRGGYTYHQMACVNATNSLEADGIILEDNVSWISKRLFLLCGSNGYPRMKNNIFYAEEPASFACMFRYRNVQEEVIYSRTIPMSSDAVRIFFGTGAAYEDGKKYLMKAMEKCMQ